MKISETIIKTAESYLGVKEIPDNRGWLNKAFQKAMELVGWRKLLHWCAFFMEMVWKEAYNTYFEGKNSDLAKDVQRDLNKLCSGNSQKTFRNFENNEFWETGRTPALGAAVIWRYSGSAGHTAACVTKITEKGFYSIEGNTSNQVEQNFHKFGEEHLLGFIYPKEF